MRIVVLANNWVGWQVVQGLRQRGEEIVGLVIHPPSERKYGPEILQAAGLPEERVFDGSRLEQPEVLEAIRDLKPDLGLSAFFAYILRPAMLGLFSQGVINVHHALLPHNRGVYPNVWSIVEGSPSGVSLHWVDQGVDSGDLIAQQEVPVQAVDTGQTLYRRLERACVELLFATWPLIKQGQAPRRPQDLAAGSFHRKADVEGIDQIDLEGTYTGRQLIDLLRARTFPPYKGAYFIHQGRRVYLRLELEWE